MATIREILEQKGSKVFTIRPDATVLEATDRMNNHRIGCMVVMDEDRVVGMFTERDVLMRVVANDRRPNDIAVEEVMTRDIVSCGPEADVDEVGAVMTERRIRHIPVCCTEGRLMGMVSIGDLNAWHASSQAATIGYLNDYIYGRV